MRKSVIGIKKIVLGHPHRMPNFYVNYFPMKVKDKNPFNNGK